MSEQPSAARPFGPGYGAQAATELAGFWRRLAAYVVDAIILGIVSSIVEAILGAIVHYSGADTTGATIRGGVVGLVLGMLYFGYMWSRYGQTLGYMALGLRLVHADGRPVSFGWPWCATWCSTCRS